MSWPLSKVIFPESMSLQDYSELSSLGQRSLHAKARGLDLTNILQNIIVALPKDSKEQESCIEEACSTVRSNNSKIKLLIIDSIMFHYRAEYP